MRAITAQVRPAAAAKGVQTVNTVQIRAPNDIERQSTGKECI